jgi:hypothetical protein
VKTSGTREPIVLSMSFTATVEPSAPTWHLRPVAPLVPTLPFSTPSPERSVEDDLALRMIKKEAKLRAEAVRPLDAWERYRALTDAIDEGFTLTEIADRKVRFALLVMAGLNVAVFAIVSRPELSGLGLRGWVAPWALAYGVVAVYFLLQAVEALRPREASLSRRAVCPGPPADALRDVATAADAEPSDCERAWREVRIDQLTAGLVAQAHALARCNHEKYASLRRLYAGLRAMAVMVAGLVALAALTAVFPSLHG